MNKLIITIAAMSVALSVTAQSKIDPGSRARMRAANAGFTVEQQADGSRKAVRKAAPASEASFGAFITLAEGYTAADLEAAGISVRSARGKVVLASLTAEEVAAAEALDAVASISIERPVATKMDRARALTGIDKIHTGEGLPQAYTGKGVLAGIVDGGFDPNHVNFSDAEGNTRIKSFTYFRQMQNGGYNTETYGSDYIPQIDTENSTTFHGSHTLGIMAGGYRGTVKGCTMVPHPIFANQLISEVSEMPNPYYGAAIESDIAIAAGAASDYLMAMGMEEILNYAYYEAMQSGQKYPVVINLSLGTNIGPHDGTSMICQYMDEVSASDEVPLIICIAAGNEGDMPIALNKTLTTDDNQLKTCFLPLDYMPTTYPRLVVGQVYVYSDTAEPFELQAVVINKSRKREALRVAIDGVPEGTEKYYVTSSSYAQAESDVVSPQLAANFEGYLGVAGMLDTTESGRYMAVVDVMLWNTAANNDQYVLGLIATGKDGQRLDAFTTGEYFYLDDLGLSEQGYAGGSTNGSISDLATGKNVIAVGSYNQRDMWGSLDGGVYTFGGVFEGNTVTGFSSYGTLVDGRNLPTVCAPGATVISSSNEYYLNDNRLGDDNRQAAVEANGRKYSWHQCTGTSMATPVVTGSIALWLEANPDLTFSDVQDIISRTSQVDADVTAGDPVKWGAGKFDAYAGLKEALNMKAGITAPVAADNSSDLLISSVAGGYELFLAGVGSMDAHLYTIAGVEAARATSDGDSVYLSTSALAPGIYIVNVNGTVSRHIVIK